MPELPEVETVKNTLKNLNYDTDYFYLHCDSNMLA